MKLDIRFILVFFTSLQIHTYECRVPSSNDESSRTELDIASDCTTYMQNLDQAVLLKVASSVSSLTFLSSVKKGFVRTTKNCAVSKWKRTNLLVVNVSCKINNNKYTKVSEHLQHRAFGCVEIKWRRRSIPNVTY